jgi:type I site-specific restriction endonuclease
MTETKKSNTRSSVLSYEDVTAVSPALEHYTKGPLLDRLWKRPEMSPRDRSIVTVAALIAPEAIAEAMKAEEADYLLFVDSSPMGVVEAKKEGDTLTGVEIQTTKYSEGVPDHLHCPRRPLPFQYQTTGVETCFTNLLEPDASSRSVFSFHRPETLDQWSPRQDSNGQRMSRVGRMSPEAKQLAA